MSGERRPRVAAIDTVDPATAEGEAAAAYRRVAGSGDPAHIYQVHSLNPPALVAHAQLYKAVMFGPSPLSRTQRELVATVVSHGNECHYWIEHHGEALRAVSEDDALAEAAKAGRWREADLDAATRALLHHAELLSRQATVGEEDRQALRDAGWNDRALLDLTLVVAYFNFVNRIASGLGVELEGGA